MINKIAKITLLIVLYFIPIAAFSAPNSMSIGTLGISIIAIAAVLAILAAMFIIYHSFFQIIHQKELIIYKKYGINEAIEEKEKEERKKTNREGWWQKFQNKMTDSVPVVEEESILLQHNYDGIMELDNNLPPWWINGFYLTIVIGIFYYGYYHFSQNAQSSQEAYLVEMQEADTAIELYLSKQANKVDESNVILLTDVEAIKEGRTIFNANCIACHLESGAGSDISVGPNLVDKYWIHGGSIQNVFKTIKYGVPEKGMIAWKEQLRPSDIHKVASYVLSLQGTNPPNGKEPQGELYVPVSDSTSLE